MKDSFYIFQSGELKRKDNTILLITSRGEKKTIPVNKVVSLHIFGEVAFNKKFLEFINKHGILLHFYNYEYDVYCGTFYPRTRNTSGYLRVKQVEHYLDQRKRMYIASAIVDGATYNMLRVISRYTQDAEPKKMFKELKNLRSSLRKANDVDELMGYEGNIRKKYYQALALAFNMEYEGRIKRPPKGELNALISFGNTLLYAETLNRLYETQLDPSISYLHEPMEQRFSLCLDIAEIFKPIIVDRVISTLIGKKMLKPNDFDKDLDATYLSESGRRKFVEQFRKRLSDTIQHPTLKRSVSYRTLIQLECYKLIKHLVNIQPYSALKVWW